MKEGSCSSHALRLSKGHDAVVFWSSTKARSRVGFVQYVTRGLRNEQQPLPGVLAPAHKINVLVSPKLTDRLCDFGFALATGSPQPRQRGTLMILAQLCEEVAEGWLRNCVPENAAEPACEHRHSMIGASWIPVADGVVHQGHIHDR